MNNIRLIVSEKDSFSGFVIGIVFIIATSIFTGVMYVVSGIFRKRE
jgi:hypothetical protein